MDTITWVKRAKTFTQNSKDVDILNQYETVENNNYFLNTFKY